MHPSYFRILTCSEGDPKGDLSLPAEISEWLFHVKFWDTINTKLETNFGQYEDDTLPSAKVSAVLGELNKLEDNQLHDPTHAHNVVYGWTETGKALEFSVRASALKSSIEELRSFLHRAIERGSDVFCQL
jgi:hypothetical protein